MTKQPLGGEALPGLLTIDVAAELRKLAEATLAGNWQVPTEFVRFAIARGAERIDADIDRRRFRVRDDGRPLSNDELGAACGVLDPRAAPAERHRALLLLEAAGASALFFLLALDPRRIAIRSSNGLRLLFAPASPPRIQGFEADGKPNLVEVEIGGFEAPQAAAYLRWACLFAPAAVRLGSDLVSVGFVDAYAETRLSEPLSGRLGLTARDGAARLLLLLDGVVAAHLTLPDWTGFEAAIEMRPLVSPRETRPAALRDAIALHAPALPSTAVDLVLSMTPRIASLGDQAADRLREVALIAARRRIHTRDVLNARLFPASVDANGQERRWFSLIELGQSAEGPARSIWTIDPQDDPAEFLVRRPPVFALSPGDRTRLAALLGVTFRRPPERKSRPSLGMFLRQAASGVRRIIREAPRTLFRRQGRPVPSGALTPAERALRDALCQHLDQSGAVTVEFWSGHGRLRSIGDGRWTLGRSDPVATVAAHAVAKDPAWIYPAALALLHGRVIPSDTARAIWHQRSLEEKDETLPG